MTQNEHASREQRARALVGLVKKVEGGYRVGSTRDPNTEYFVSKVDGQICCSCPDFEKHFQEDPGWECKHVLAVKLAHKLGKVNGKPAAQADLEAQAMFGDPEAARQLDAQAQQEGTETATATIDPSEEPVLSPVEGEEAGGDAAPGFNLSGSVFELIEVEEEVQLEPCLVCKTKTPADEMIPVTAPSGTGLVCRTCYDGRKACAFCGARLPVERLVTVPTSSGAGLACEDCYSKSRSCSLCGDHFLAEQMVMVREPNFFGYFCSECAREREAEQRAEVRPVPTLQERIARVNEILAAWGLVAIETDQKGYTGYGFQYTIDAVNSALGLSAWRYKLLDQQVEKSDGKTFRAQVTLQLELCLDDGSWFTRGTQFGGSQNVDAADALKGALSDGLKKAFSHWGIGNLAYRGELNANSNNRK